MPVPRSGRAAALSGRHLSHGVALLIMIARSSRGRDSLSLWQRGGGGRCPQQASLGPVTFVVTVPVARDSAAAAGWAKPASCTELWSSVPVPVPEGSRRSPPDRLRAAAKISVGAVPIWTVRYNQSSRFAVQSQVGRPSAAAIPSQLFGIYRRGRSHRDNAVPGPETRTWARSLKPWQPDGPSARQWLGPGPGSLSA